MILMVEWAGTGRGCGGWSDWWLMVSGYGAAYNSNCVRKEGLSRLGTVVSACDDEFVDSERELN